jgi:hypothetical protein
MTADKRGGPMDYLAFFLAWCWENYDEYGELPITEECKIFLVETHAPSCY